MPLREHAASAFTQTPANVVVTKTRFSGVFLEYNALVLSDCVRDMTPELHDTALRRIEMFFWLGLCLERSGDGLGEGPDGVAAAHSAVPVLVSPSFVLSSVPMRIPAFGLTSAVAITSADLPRPAVQGGASSAPVPSTVWHMSQRVIVVYSAARHVR